MALLALTKRHQSRHGMDLGAVAATGAIVAALACEGDGAAPRPSDLPVSGSSLLAIGRSSAWTSLLQDQVLLGTRSNRSSNVRIAGRPSASAASAAAGGAADVASVSSAAGRLPQTQLWSWLWPAGISSCEAEAAVPGREERLQASHIYSKNR